MHVVEAFGGGVANCVAAICRVVSDRIQSVIVHGDRDFSQPLCSSLEQVRFVRWKVSREIGRKDLGALRDLIRIIRMIDPDVIHLHSSKAGALGRIAVFLLGRQALYTPHSYAFLRQDVSRTKRSLYRGVERLLARQGRTVACGIEEYAMARQFGGAVTIIANTVDFSDFQARVRSDDKPGRGVIAVGRICAQKDFGFFCEVAQVLPDTSFTWVSGLDEFVPRVPPNVLVVGSLRPQELAAALEGSAVFLNTSLWEGLSKAVIEACAMGLPLVLRDVPGNRELPYLGAHAILFHDVPECVQALQTLLMHDRPEVGATGNRALARRLYQSGGREYEMLYLAEAYAARCGY